MAATTTRERFRAQIRDEVKQAALRQLAAAGPQGVSVNAIAKELGVSGPALYRYFESRDALLGELVADAYRDLGAAVAAASAPHGARSRDRFRAFARAYRGWAIAQPHRYRLLYAPPLPGIDAHAEPVAGAQAVMDGAAGRHPGRTCCWRPAAGGAGRWRRPALPRRRCAPCSSGRGCTAWSAWSSAATSPRWASTRTSCSRRSCGALLPA